MSIEQIPVEGMLGRSSVSTKIDVDKAGVVPLGVNINITDSDKSAIVDIKKTEEVESKVKLTQDELAKEEEDKESLLLEPNMVDIEQSIEAINQILPLRNTNLIFEFDDLNDPPIVKVIDKNTDEVIREIPPKNIRDIAKALNDMADSIDKSGLLFSSKV